MEKSQSLPVWIAGIRLYCLHKVKLVKCDLWKNWLERRPSLKCLFILVAIFVSRLWGVICVRCMSGLTPSSHQALQAYKVVSVTTNATSTAAYPTIHVVWCTVYYKVVYLIVLVHIWSNMCTLCSLGPSSHLEAAGQANSLESKMCSWKTQVCLFLILVLPPNLPSEHLHPWRSVTWNLTTSLQREFWCKFTPSI